MVRGSPLFWEGVRGDGGEEEDALGLWDVDWLGGVGGEDLWIRDGSYGRGPWFVVSFKKFRAEVYMGVEGHGQVRRETPQFFRYELAD